MIAADDANEDDREADERRQQTQDAVEEDRFDPFCPEINVFEE